MFLAATIDWNIGREQVLLLPAMRLLFCNLAFNISYIDNDLPSNISTML